MVGDQGADTSGYHQCGNQVAGQQSTHSRYDDAMLQASGYRVGPIRSGRNDEQKRHRPEGNKDTEGHGVTHARSSIIALFIIPPLIGRPSCFLKRSTAVNGWGKINEMLLELTFKCGRIFVTVREIILRGQN